MADESPLFRDLRREAPPNDALKRRVTRSLQDAGLLATRRWSRTGFIAIAAGLVIAFAGGYLAGTWRGGVRTEAPRFMLLLYEDADFHMTRPLEQIVAEYSSWADSLRANGRLERGEELGTDQELVGPPLPPGVTSAGQGGSVTGFFVIRAATLREAADIARTCPHLRYGGRIAVRPIDAT